MNSWRSFSSIAKVNEAVGADGLGILLLLLVLLSNIGAAVLDTARGLLRLVKSIGYRYGDGSSSRLDSSSDSKKSPSLLNARFSIQTRVKHTVRMAPSSINPPTDDGSPMVCFFAMRASLDISTVSRSFSPQRLPTVVPVLRSLYR